jgi:hypothetical protein
MFKLKIGSERRAVSSGIYLITSMDIVSLP